MQARPRPTPITNADAARCGTRGNASNRRAVYRPEAMLRRRSTDTPTGQRLDGGTRLPADTRTGRAETPIAGLADAAR